MKIGSNMKKVLRTAKRARGEFVALPIDGLLGQKAAASLERAGLIATRKRKGNVIEVKFKADPATATASASTGERRPRAVNPESKFQQAIAYARKRKSLKRTDLVTWLQENHDMSPAGSNTYATAVLKNVAELRA